MSYPRNEFEVDFRVPDCMTPQCTGKIEWNLDEDHRVYYGRCEDGGAIYDGPTEAQELTDEYREDKY